MRQRERERQRKKGKYGDIQTESHTDRDTDKQITNERKIERVLTRCVFNVPYHVVTKTRISHKMSFCLLRDVFKGNTSLCRITATACVTTSNVIIDR